MGKKKSDSLNCSQGLEDSGLGLKGCAIRTRSYMNQPAQIEIREDEIANQITTVQKDSMIIEGSGSALKVQMIQVPRGFNKGFNKGVSETPPLSTSAWEQNNFIASGQTRSINTPARSTGKGLDQASCEKVTSEKSQAQIYPTMTCSAVASLVKVFPLRENVKVFKTSQGELFSSKSVESYEIKDQRTYCLKTLKDYFLTTTEEPSQLYSFRWMSLGMMRSGLSQTLSISYHKTGKGSLSSVLEDEVDEKYYLSEKMVEFLEKRMIENQGKRGQVKVDAGEGISSCIKEGTTRDSSVTFINQSRIRRLIPKECERLQGFPDNFTAEGDKGVISDSQRYKMCGNAVSVPVIEAIGKKILEVIG